ncbi:MAG: glycosyltransferase family 4 protein [Bacteroidota bacterium]
MKVVLPISIDRWSNPISSKFRELVVHSKGSGINYYSLSNPVSEEDRRSTSALWGSNLRKLTASSLLTNEFDIVHRSTATRSNTLITRLIHLRSSKIKNVYTIGVEPHKTDKYHKHILQAIKNADYLIANSHSVARAVQEVLGMEVNKVIHNGIDPVFFDSNKADPWTLKKNKIYAPYMLFNSAMLERKRPDLYIDLARKFPEVPFVMIGRDTSLSEYYLKTAPKNVIHLGEVTKSDSRDITARAMAVIFTSELEGLPNAVLEAVTLGTPVVAQKVSSLPEIINTTNGWLLDDTSVASWSSHIEQVISMSDEESKKRSQASRADALSRFSWQQYADEHVAFYKMMVNA